MVGRRYGKLPSELVMGPLDKLGFNVAVALIGINHEAEMRKKAQDGTQPDSDGASMEKLFGQSSWGAGKLPLGG